MAKVFLVFLLVSSHCAWAGYFVQKSLYVPHHVVIGRGATLAQAEKDALRAVPKISKNIFFEPDSNFNSPAYQCAGEGLQWNEKTECQGSDIQIVIPLRKVTR